MKKILWFSRHEMCPEQIKELLGAFGELEIIQPSKKSIVSADEIADDIMSCDALCVVAPLNLQIQFLKLLNGRAPMLISKSKHIGNPENRDEVAFCFDHWEVVDKINIESHPLMLSVKGEATS